MDRSISLSLQTAPHPPRYGQVGVHSESNQANNGRRCQALGRWGGKMKYQTTTFLGFCALFIALPLGDLLADTLHVPRPYGTIQAAIEVAENGDVIVIAADTYSPTATIDTLGKAITLRGAVDRQGLPTTIIDGRGKMRVLRCVETTGGQVVFENLQIQNG